jgi:hypothetical protein
MEEASDPQHGLSDVEADGNVEGISQARLVDLTAQATLKYSIKDYSAAAELYSEATELQAELYGEMSSKNADLLYPTAAVYIMSPLATVTS